MDKSAAYGGWQRVQSRRRPTPKRRPFIPSMDGCCYRCLAWDHQEQMCLKPAWCRLYCQAWHRVHACPRATRAASRLEPPQRAPRGLFACHVGEIIDADSTWTQILDCIQEISPSSTHLVCHRLASRHILLRDLSKEEWLTIRGWMHQCIRWQRPRPIDRGVLGVDGDSSAGAMKRPLWILHMAAPGVGHVGALQKIVCNELQSSNPHYICADVEVPVGSVTLATISLAGGWVAYAVLTAALPPPPPRSSCPHTTTASGSPTPDRSAAAAQGRAAS